MERTSDVDKLRAMGLLGPYQEWYGTI
jgi:hypothetical protein